MGSAPAPKSHCRADSAAHPGALITEQRIATAWNHSKKSGRLRNRFGVSKEEKRSKDGNSVGADNTTPTTTIHCHNAPR
jgi:hypothetical protein